MRLRALLDRVQRAGFEGPFYRGLTGKARFVFETVAWRTEFIFVGTKESMAAARPASRAIEVSLRTIRSFPELEKFKAELDAEYYPGYVNQWRAPFTWGEQVVLGLVGDRLAGFAWVQRGSAAGFPTYYGRLYEKDARILRVGVVPGFRRRGVNAAMMRELLASLLNEGFERVFAESHKFNVPSVRTFLGAGFRPASAIRVVSIPGKGEHVRWLAPAAVERHLKDLDLGANSSGH